MKGGVKRKYVMIVEDDLTALHALRMQMRQILPQEILIETANDGIEAMEVLEHILENGGVVPVVISDHQMPKRTGAEFLIMLKGLVPKCRTIMLTGEAGLNDISKLINEQALYMYVTKPWTQAELEMTVRSALEAFEQEYRLDYLNWALTETNEKLERLVDARTRELVSKTHELNTSIDYATTIQSVLMPSASLFKGYFQDAEIMYRPYDRVSGDFYVFHQANQNQALVVIGDATGHGVAGAFISCLCVGMIRNIIETMPVDSPVEVLTNVLKRFRTFSQSVSEALKEMVTVELTVVCFDRSKQEIKYASNSKQIMLFNNGVQVNPLERVFECCLGNKETQRSLSNRGRQAEVEMSKVDTIVLHTDGVQHQFLESTGKKMGTKKLRERFTQKSDDSLMEWFKSVQGSEVATDDATILKLTL